MLVKKPHRLLCQHCINHAHDVLSRHDKSHKENHIFPAARLSAYILIWTTFYLILPHGISQRTPFCSKRCDIYDRSNVIWANGLKCILTFSKKIKIIHSRIHSQRELHFIHPFEFNLLEHFLQRNPLFFLLQPLALSPDTLLQIHGTAMGVTGASNGHKCFLSFGKVTQTTVILGFGRGVCVCVSEERRQRQSEEWIL